MTKQLGTSNSGMTLIEVMMATAVSSIVILASVSVGQMTIQSQAQNNISFQADTIRRNMLSLLTSTASWNYTIAGTCIATGTYCTDNGLASGHILVNQTINSIKNAAGNDVYLVASPRGFNADGSPCTGSGTFKCPLTYSVQWTPICVSAATCINPQIQVVATPTYNAPTASGSQQLIFNAANYSLLLYH